MAVTPDKFYNFRRSSWNNESERIRLCWGCHQFFLPPQAQTWSFLPRFSLLTNARICWNMQSVCQRQQVRTSFTCEHREPIDAREPAAELQPLHTERCKNTPNHILPEKLVIWACCIRRKCNILNISVDVSIQRIFSTRTSTDVFLGVFSLRAASKWF